MWQKQGSMFLGGNSKKFGNLLDPIRITGPLQKFMGHSQISRLECFKRVWSYIKTNNLQDPNKRSKVICDEKLKSIAEGKSHIDLVDLPILIKAHFPKAPQ